jgi:hypothetical protein
VIDAFNTQFPIEDLVTFMFLAIVRRRRRTTNNNNKTEKGKEKILTHCHSDPTKE